MKRIDIHTHLIPEKLPSWADKFGYGGFVNLEHQDSCTARMMIDGKFFREIQSNCWEPKQRLIECDQHQISLQVLSTIPVLFSYWAQPRDAFDVSRFLNDHMADVVRRYPDRFIGLGTVPLQDPDLAVRELERCVSLLGLAGVEIGSHVNDWNLNAPELFPFYAAAEELGACLFVHPWDMMGKEKMNKYWLPWLVGMPAETSLAICSMIFGGVFERFPNLRVAFAHGGGSFPGSYGRIRHGFDVRPDLVAVDNPVHPDRYLGRFWVDSLVHDVDMLDKLVALFGIDKVALGSDYPFPLGELSPGKLIAESGYDEDEKSWLFYKSAESWLGIL
ncbi:MAG TPA: amidohydrolase family protein [Saprospiraceae bacterium]|nr:amidohydrolase family protein [Saprospiraceae bacterium]